MKLNERDLQAAMHDWAMNRDLPIDETGWLLVYSLGEIARHTLSAKSHEDLEPVHALAKCMIQVMVLAQNLGTFISFEEGIVFAYAKMDIGCHLAMAGALKSVGEFITDSSQWQQGLRGEGFDRTHLQGLMNHLFLLARLRGLHAIMNVLMPYWTEISK